MMLTAQACPVPLDEVIWYVVRWFDIVIRWCILVPTDSVTDAVLALI